MELVGDLFISRYIYPLFSAKNDAEMLSQMVWIGIFYTLTVIVSMLVLPAPYGNKYCDFLMIAIKTLLVSGRYSDSRFGFLVPFKLAWFSQESPAFILPLLLLLTTSSPCWTASTVNKIFVAAFIIHYVQRSLIYPLTSVGAKPIPLAPYLSAMAFTVFNGFMQSRYLLTHQCYKDEWMASPQFIIGTVSCILMRGKKGVRGPIFFLQPNFEI